MINPRGTHSSAVELWTHHPKVVRLNPVWACVLCPWARHFTLTKGVTLVYLNTVIRWTRLTRQKSKCVDSLYLYDNTHIYACTWKTRLRPISHWTFMMSLVCKVGLYCSSASINQLFNTKNSFLQLLSRKATLKCEVLFKSVFFTNLFTWNCSKKC